MSSSNIMDLLCMEQKAAEAKVYELNHAHDCLDKPAKHESKMPQRAREGVKKITN